jgi:hypothetical protein
MDSLNNMIFDEDEGFFYAQQDYLKECEANCEAIGYFN